MNCAVAGFQRKNAYFSTQRPQSARIISIPLYLDIIFASFELNQSTVSILIPHSPESSPKAKLFISKNRKTIFFT